MKVFSRALKRTEIAEIKDGFIIDYIILSVRRPSRVVATSRASTSRASTCSGARTGKLSSFASFGDWPIKRRKEMEKL